MIVKETNPNSTWSHKYLDLSDSEKVRVKEIFEELRSIFNATHIGIVQPKILVGRKRNYIIKLYNGDIVGYMLEKERIKDMNEELRSIFNADSIDFIPGNAILGLGCLGRKCDYELKIYNGDTIGYILDLE
jgi:hypothetical protein